MKVVIRTIADLKARRTTIAEATVEDGRWIDAAEDALNARYGYEGDERRHLIVARYLGGGPQEPFGLHTVQFARYDPKAIAYRHDEILRLEVLRDG